MYSTRSGATRKPMPDGEGESYGPLQRESLQAGRQRQKHDRGEGDDDLTFELAAPPSSEARLRRHEQEPGDVAAISRRRYQDHASA